MSLSAGLERAIGLLDPARRPPPRRSRTATSTCWAAPEAAAGAPHGALVGAATGLRVFGREEITRALEARGFEDVRRRVSGLAQFVGARRTPA